MPNTNTALIIAKDYWGTHKGEETATKFYDFLLRHDIITSTACTRLYGNAVSCSAVQLAIEEFIGHLDMSGTKGFIYMVGHGNQIQDLSGSEDDGRDEVYQLPDGVITDDWITNQLSRMTNENAFVVLISDHCSSGSMIDVAAGTQCRWVSVGSSHDHEDSFATGDGNVMTTVLLQYLDALEPITLKAMTATGLGERLPLIMLDSCIGDMQHVTVHASQNAWTQPLFN